MGDIVISSGYDWTGLEAVLKMNGERVLYIPFDFQEWDLLKAAVKSGKRLDYTPDHCIYGGKKMNRWTLTLRQRFQTPFRH